MNQRKGKESPAVRNYAPIWLILTALLAIFLTDLATRPLVGHDTKLMHSELAAMGMPADVKEVSRKVLEPVCSSNQWDGPELVVAVRWDGVIKDRITSELYDNAWSTGFRAPRDGYLSNTPYGFVMEKRINGRAFQLIYAPDSEATGTLRLDPPVGRPCLQVFNLFEPVVP